MEHSPPVVLDQAQWQAIEQAYATPPRAYHDFGHVRALWRHYDEVQAGPGWRHPADVWLAILFHDAVYRPGRSDNERQSARMAREWVARWWPDAGFDLDRIERLILLTARHGQLQPQDVDAETALFLDCDMAILAAPDAVFDAYGRGIAEEYRGHVPALLFRMERKRFLRALLALPRIFLSDFFHERCDAAARANLRRAIDGADAEA